MIDLRDRSRIRTAASLDIGVRIVSRGADRRREDSVLSHADSAIILDGKKLAQQIRQELAAEVATLTSTGAAAPCLAAVLVGEDPASEVYVRNKQRDCRQVGIQSQLHQLAAQTTEQELLSQVDNLNRDDAIDGILVQLPLPSQIDQRVILEAIAVEKDVDAFHPENVGRLIQGQPRFLPCTPAGIQELLVRHQIVTAGKRAVVVGRSDIVGKPMAMMLALRGRGADATVTLCHSKTSDLSRHTREAEILVVAAGQPELVTGEMIQPGATVIDVGIHRTAAGLVGDVHFESAARVAGHITPVPGGVGPLTRVMLLVNTLAAARRRRL